MLKLASLARDSNASPPVFRGRIPDGRTIVVAKHDEDFNRGYYYSAKLQGIEVLAGWFDSYDIAGHNSFEEALNALLLTPEQVKESIDRTESVGDAPANILSALEEALAGETTEQVIAGLKAMRTNASTLVGTLDKMLASFDKPSAN
jgi:hypothetical protein